MIHVMNMRTFRYRTEGLLPQPAVLRYTFTRWKRQADVAGFEKLTVAAISPVTFRYPGVKAGTGTEFHPRPTMTEHKAAFQTRAQRAAV